MTFEKETEKIVNALWSARLFKQVYCNEITMDEFRMRIDMMYPCQNYGKCIKKNLQVVGVVLDIDSVENNNRFNSLIDKTHRCYWDAITYTDSQNEEWEFNDFQIQIEEEIEKIHNFLLTIK